MAAAPCLIGLTLRLQSFLKMLLNDIPLVATIRVGVQIAQALRDHLSVPLRMSIVAGRVVIRSHSNAR
jgi:hypothetical protein